VNVVKDNCNYYSYKWMVDSMPINQDSEQITLDPGSHNVKVTVCDVNNLCSTYTVDIIV